MSSNGANGYHQSAVTGLTHLNGVSEKNSSASDPVLPATLQRRDSGQKGKRMLENVFGVEARSAQPRKKIKAPDDQPEELRSHQPAFNSSGTGIIGDYMRRTDDPQAPNGYAPVSTTQDQQVVDLTNDDDDFIITASNSLADKQVYYGTVHADVAAYMVPMPRSGKIPQNGMWPPMRCSVHRNPEDAKTAKIAVFDPQNKPFGNIEQRIAVPIASLMDNQLVRIDSRLLPHKQQGNQQPHQPCSQNLKIGLSLYGRQGDAQRIGKHLGQHNVWLINSPSMRDEKFEIHNPHQVFHRKTKPREGPRTTVTRNVGASIEAGSEEEMERSMARLFDHYASENIEETDSPPSVLTPLLPHQKQALTFMLEHEKPPNFEDDDASKLWSRQHRKNGEVYYQEAVSNIQLDKKPPLSLGGLLADVMGLGKTLESLTLIAATTDAAEIFSETPVDRSKETSTIINAAAKGTLIICPMSTVANWENQIKEHLSTDFSWYTHHGSNREKNAFELLKYDIVITTYGTLQSEARREGDGVLRCLKWFRVILDEAHTIRESASQQSQACFELAADRRWCLTGTPIQNKLADLGSLCQFLQIYPYDTVKDFQYYIGKRAGSGDSTFLVKLRVFIDSFTLRRQRDKIDLPPREDLIATVEFSESERKLHEFFRQRAELVVEDIARQRDDTSEGKEKRKNLQISVLQGITLLRLISAHGRDLLRQKDLDAFKGADASEPIDLDEEDQPKSMTKLEAFELFKMMSDADFDVCRNCDTPITARSPLAEADDTVRCVVLPCRDLVCATCFRQYQYIYDYTDDKEPVDCKLCGAITTSTYVPIRGSVNDEIEVLQASEMLKVKDTYTGPHSKTLALLADIDQMKEDSKAYEAKGEPPLKCVVFSEFTSHLNLLARALKDKGYSTARIDGSMSLNKRKKVLAALDTDNDLTILLASIKAAGQGLNLTAASRAFIMEPLWNPAAEAQAVDRIYRIGQHRPVLIKRYHMKDSIEEAIIKLADKKRKLAETSMNRNHKTLSKKELREQHYNDIKALFQAKKR